MGYIYYRLTRASSLRGMAPPARPGGNFGDATLPARMDGVAGMYIIINTQVAPYNRYIGISSDIGSRFGPRMAVVTEMGFPEETMDGIYVVWGRVKVRDEGLPIGANTKNVLERGNEPATIAYPKWDIGGWTRARPVRGGGAFTASIDGQLINLEHLLIRFVMDRLGVGGTISNNQLVRPFSHPGGAHPLRVRFKSGGFGAYDRSDYACDLAPGGRW